MSTQAIRTQAATALGAATLCEAFQLTALARPEQIALRTPGGERELSFAQYAERVRTIATGLHALGVRRGDTVALMLTNRPEFHLVDTAAIHLGAIPFSLYNTASSEQIVDQLANAESRVAVCERRFAELLERARPPRLERIVVIDGPPGEHPGATPPAPAAEPATTLALADLERLGDGEFDFEAAWRAVRPEDVLTLIYTSGTTGPPKGVHLTHRNLMAEARAVAAVLPARAGGRYTSYLPHAHIADRFFGHYYPLIVSGGTVTCISEVSGVIAALPAVRPTGWGSVPRIWEKLKAGLEAGGLDRPAALSDDERAAVRSRLGLDAAEWLVCGAAPVAPEVLEYFHHLGLSICELFGMSELSCCATINPPSAIRIGTVGVPLPGVELALGPDRELLCRGAIVMAGYRGDPERTAEALDADGWLHTGDIAEIDGDGYVRIVDRKKELIINAAGKNMSPANIEMRLKSAGGLIGQAMCVGDRRPFNVALIVLDPDAAQAWAQAHGLADASAAALAADPGVQAAVAAAVEEANRHLSRVEQIKRHAILPLDWQPGGEELTPTLKLRRRIVEAKYAAEIEALYAAE